MHKSSLIQPQNDLILLLQFISIVVEYLLQYYCYTLTEYICSVQRVSYIQKLCVSSSLSC